MGAAVAWAPVGADEGLAAVVAELALEAAVVGLLELWLLLEEHAPSRIAKAMVPTTGTDLHRGIICELSSPNSPNSFEASPGHMQPEGRCVHRSCDRGTRYMKVLTAGGRMSSVKRE
jgi:hypothetical protein